MCAVDRLNVYTPFTVGWVIVGGRYSRTWIPGIIMGRVMGHRRVITAEGSVFIEHEEQFKLTRPWVGTKSVHLSRI